LKTLKSSAIAKLRALSLRQQQLSNRTAETRKVHTAAFGALAPAVITSARVFVFDL
jgi:hypothetical protein